MNISNVTTMHNVIYEYLCRFDSVLAGEEDIKPTLRDDYFLIECRKSLAQAESDLTLLECMMDRANQKYDGGDLDGKH